MNPFDYVNSISLNKKNLMRGTENDELAEKDYVPFIVNKSLSYFKDTLLYSNEMNKYSFVDNKLQYEYLLNSIRPNKRFSKWAKKETSNDIIAISKYFDVSLKKAEEYIKLLKESDVKEIVAKTEKI